MASRSLPLKKTEIGVRRASDQIKADNIGSISQSATLLGLITGQSPTADHAFTKIIHELSGLSISQHTESEIQEVLDEVALNKLIENQTSERGKNLFIVTLSASVRSLVMGSSHPSIAKRISCSSEVKTGRSHV